MIKKFFLIIMLSFSCVCATSIKDEVVNSQEFIREIPKELTSANGVKFWFLKDTSSKLVHINIAFMNCGAAYLQKSKAGTASLYAQSIFCGAGKYSKQEFEKQCHDNSISISCLADVDNIKFSLTTSEIVLKEAVELLNAVLVSPTFEEKEVLKVQNSLDVDNVVLQTLLLAEIFKSHAYERGALGTPEDYVKLTVADLKDYKKRFIVKKNAKIFVCGSIDEQRAIALVDKVFSKMNEGQKAKDTVADVAPKLSAKITQCYLEGPQSRIEFAFKNESCLSDKRRAAMILCNLLGSMSFLQNRIMTNLRTKQGLIYAGGVYPLDMNHANIIVGELLTDNNKVQKAIKALKTVVKELREKGVTQKELDLVKSHMLGIMLVKLRTSRALGQFYFQNMLRGFGVDVLRKVVNEINNVTLSDVNAMVKELLDDKNLSIIVIGGNA